MSASARDFGHMSVNITGEEYRYTVRRLNVLGSHQAQKYDEHEKTLPHNVLPPRRFPENTASPAPSLLSKMNVIFISYTVKKQIQIIRSDDPPDLIMVCDTMSCNDHLVTAMHAWSLLKERRAQAGRLSQRLSIRNIISDQSRVADVAGHNPSHSLYSGF